MHGIERDHDRFRKIIRSRLKENLKKYMTQDGLKIYGKDGKHKILVPIPRINLPQFTRGNPPDVRQDGQNGGQGSGQGSGGDEAPESVIEVGVTLEEIANLLAEELQLPRIEPKGKSQILSELKKYRSLRHTGPNSLLHFKRTFLEATKRSIAAGEYDPDDPFIVPIKEDRRYRSFKPITLPQNQAVIIYIMDVSGSMGQEEKEMARLTSFWIDLWLRSQYKDKLVSRYIIHHTEAKEVDQYTFYHTMEGGGTKISSAYTLSSKIIKEEHPVSDWNSYIFQYSDGDDWDEGVPSTNACNIIADLLPHVNQISYCQVRDGGNFKQSLENRFSKEPKVVIATAFQKDQILGAIKSFFQQGR